MSNHAASDDLLAQLKRLRELQSQVQIQIDVVLAEFERRTNAIREQVEQANGKPH